MGLRTEKLGRLYTIKGKKNEEVKEIACGDIGAIAKMDRLKTGETLCDPKCRASPGARGPDPRWCSAASPCPGPSGRSRRPRGPGCPRAYPSKSIAPVVAPIWDENKRTIGIIDVLNKKAYKMPENKKGKREEIPIPESKMKVVDELYGQLMEAVAETTEENMEKFFAPVLGRAHQNAHLGGPDAGLHLAGKVEVARGVQHVDLHPVVQCDVPLEYVL